MSFTVEIVESPAQVFQLQTGYIDWSQVANKPDLLTTAAAASTYAAKATTLAGYGITDAITAAAAASMYAAKATTLAGYGITDGLTSAAAASTYVSNSSLSTTLSFYLTAAAAASTYLTSASAASVYAPKASPVFTGSLTLPNWTTAGRPASPSNGMIGWNTDLLRFDHYTPTGWKNFVRLDGDTMTGPLASPSFTGDVSFAAASRLLFSTDLIAQRNAAGVWDQRNGTNAQAWRLFNTYTNGSTYEAFSIDWQTTANVVRVGTEGSTLRNLWLMPGAATGIGIGAGWVNDTNVILHSKPAAGSVRALWAQESNNNGTNLGLQCRGLNTSAVATTMYFAAVFNGNGGDNCFMAMAPTNGTNGLRVTQNFNMGLNGGSFGGGSGTFFMLTAITEPTSAPTNGAILYVDASGNVKVYTKAGNIRTVAAV